MAAGEGSVSGALTPVAVVWCRQVDNEAESPGYTTIPEEFPGRRETLEAIRTVGNLTINIADTHDYWDPDPSQPLSFYPNIFLYPAANGRYTCVGRMFLSTEDRPRLGMKTIVLETAPLIAGGAFGADVLRAHATMSGKSEGTKPPLEPDPSVYQTVGEGFLFHRGTTEPVVVVASDQWEASCQAVLELVRAMPASLVALGAFLVFPYFLPEAKVNLHEFTEQFPLSLAVMRVPRGEAQGDRHAKRLQSWESAPVTLRDLTRPNRGREALPLVLQYVREHQDAKVSEVTRRVDLVEAPQLQARLHDTDRQGGRDRRKEMWRIGTAMETAALLLTRPKGRAVPMTSEAAKRANEYLQARPAEGTLLPAEPVASFTSAPPVSSGDLLAGQHPPWLHKPPEVNLPASAAVGVPVSTSDDPSALPPGAVSAPPPPGPSAPTSPAPAELEAMMKAEIDRRFADLSKTRPAGADPSDLMNRFASATRELEAKWSTLLDTRLREFSDASSKAVLALQSDISSRLAAIEARPVVSPSDIATEAEQKVMEAHDARFRTVTEKVQSEIRAQGEMWAARVRDELKQSVDALRAQATHDEEEMRAALVAQIDLELREAQEQGTSLREEIEGRLRDLLKERNAETEAKRAKETRELEQRLGLLIDGRTKDVESRLQAANADLKEKLAAAQEDRVAQAEKRWSMSGEARIAETHDAQSQALAGLQVRLQSYFEQKLRENQEREREKYVELLARLKSDVDQSLAKTIDSSKFDAVIRDRVARGLEAGREDQEKAIQQAVGEAEVRLSSQNEEGVVRLERLEAKIQTRETDLLRLEQTLRHEVDDLDRRIQVVADRALPLIRRTWLRVSELEKEGPGATETEARIKELRREMARELRRLEGELLEQTGDLRDRLEATLASQGRIWLNLMKQLQNASEGLARTEVQVRRTGAHSGSDVGLEELLDENLRDATDYPDFASDPPNPLDPRPNEPSADVEARDTRRRPRRVT
ncbi:MAG TPA: hypothetical protein VMH38_03395 [Thermoplasmata archaeon]|nr:hypothetical protein [Thermoplasmata archaeon]